MKGNIVGFRTVDYVNRENERVTGVNLCIAYEDSEVFGRNVKEIFIGANKPLYLQFQPYLTGDITPLLDCPCDFDYAVDMRNGKTYARLASFKIYPVVNEHKKG